VKTAHHLFVGQDFSGAGSPAENPAFDLFVEGNENGDWRRVGFGL
jgi:hypothetical protein